MDEDTCAIVIDSGSAMMKAGFAGDEAPRSIFPSIVGTVRDDEYKGGIANKKVKEDYVGDCANEKAKTDLLDIKHPIEKGVVKSWDDMETLWNHIFYNELRAQPEEHGILLTECSLIPKLTREKMAEIMFETFNAPSLYIGMAPILSLFAAGLTTGIVLDSGYNVTNIVPVCAGHASTYQINKLKLGGYDITNYLKTLLYERGKLSYKLLETQWKKKQIEWEIVRNIKEKLGYVSLDYNNDISKIDPSFLVASNESTDFDEKFELPNGDIITICEERFKCTELLFKPNLHKYELLYKPYELGYETKATELVGIHKLIYDSIMKCDKDSRNDLYSNIVLAGGNTMFDGIETRLTNEIQQLVPVKVWTKIKLVAPPERKYSAWIGGSILSQLTTFQQMWITKDEYDEYGPAIVHKKCI